MIVYGPGLREWLEAKLGDKLPADAQFIGRVLKENDSIPVAVVGFSNFTGDDIEISVASDRGGGTVGLVESVFSYAFANAGCSRITIHIRDDNAQSLKMAKRLGFTYEGTKRKAKAGHDLHIYGLLREEYGRQRTQGTNTSRPAKDHRRTDQGEPGQPDYPVRVADLRPRRNTNHEPVARHAGGSR